MRTCMQLAYLDPGTGSLALQLLVGGVLGAALAIKMFWRRILSLLGRKPPPDEGAPRQTTDSAKPER